MISSECRGSVRQGSDCGGNAGETAVKIRKDEGTGFRMIFDAEMKRQEGKDSESEEADTEPEGDHEGARIEVGELAGQGRG